MVKKKITKSVKKQNKNINIKIHIDQSKRTTGSNPRKSNIKTLPAYSAAPSSGGNYIRQFVQDPYNSQSQNEEMNLLKQYNNLVKKNNPATRVLDSEKNKNRNYPQITSGFQDINQNGQQLVKANNYQYDDESVTEQFIDNAMYDDPRTNGDSQNAIYNFRPQTAQKLPTTQNELAEDEDEDEQEVQQKFEQKLIEGSVSDPILKLMYSDKEYDEQGIKIFRESDIKPNKYFNKTSGKWVLGYGSKISKLREEDPLKSVESNYTRDPYSINLNLRLPTTNLYARNTGWRDYIKKVKVEEKEDEKGGEKEGDDEEEIQPKQEKAKIKKNKSTMKKVKIGKN